MIQNAVIQLTCSQCGHTVKVKRPQKAGKYQVPCPQCQSRIVLVVKEQAAIPAAEATTDQNVGGGSSQQPAVQQPVAPAQPAQPPVPNNAFQDERTAKGDFIENMEAHVECAFGCGYVHTDTPTKLGPNRFICPRCKGRNVYQVRGRTLIKSVDKEFQPFRGKLILLRRKWFNKDFILVKGSNLVGRYDPDPRENSDIAISDDPSMSRRSIEILVEYNDLSGYTFFLRVLRATNPVLVNNNPLHSGEGLSLNFEDSIILGKTQFRFVKDV